MGRGKAIVMSKQIGADDLGIDTRSEQGMFEWFLASLLFGRPVSPELAAASWRRFIDDGWVQPARFVSDDPHALWQELWLANYHRLSSVMHEELRAAMTVIITDYHSSVMELVNSAVSSDDLSRRLQTIKGVGPKTAEIFLREVPPELIGSSPVTES